MTGGLCLWREIAKFAFSLIFFNTFFRVELVGINENVMNGNLTSS